MVTIFVDMRRAPGLMLGQVGHVPDALVVRLAVEFEGENARPVGGCTAVSGAHLFRLFHICKDDNNN